MRPFRFFFGLSIAVILFFFVARILFFALIIAAVLSILYAIVRRIRDFISHERDQGFYKPVFERSYTNRNGFDRFNKRDSEPLFYEDHYQERTSPIDNIQFVDIK